MIFGEDFLNRNKIPVWRLNWQAQRHSQIEFVKVEKTLGSDITSWHGGSRVRIVLDENQPFEEENGKREKQSEKGRAQRNCESQNY